MLRRPPRPTLSPYTPLFRSLADRGIGLASVIQREPETGPADVVLLTYPAGEASLQQAEAELARLPCTRASSASACCREDRKSTRLNSSHLVISYAVFCLKKK